MRINSVCIQESLFQQKQYSSSNTFGRRLFIPKSTPVVEPSTQDIYEKGLKKISRFIFGLSKRDIKNLESEINVIKQQIEISQKRLLAFRRLLDYDRLRKSGVSQNELNKYILQDDKIIEDIQQTLKEKNDAKNTYFGYPINLCEDSAVVEYLKHKEQELPLLNNCADTYEQGNSQLNSKEIEKRLLSRLYKHFGLEEPVTKDVLNPTTNKYEKQHIGAWGYVTSGGSESNRWGIENGLKKFPNGHVYYSKAAHYSVDKAVNLGTDNYGNAIKILRHTVIPTNKNSETINSEILLNTVRKNWTKKHQPAVILLTWGTTKTGAIDDVQTISKILLNEKIPHYIHLDAALSGGIPTNQINAPQPPNIKQLGVDSVSVSLHKYFGCDEAKSVLIAQEKPQVTKIDYIGQGDGTTAGSRSFKPFSALQRIKEILDRSHRKEYIKNVQKFETLLNKYDIPFSREFKSNTFVIDKPSDEVCKKYQLSTFVLPVTNIKTGKTKLKEKAHVIIFPYHKEEIMKQLAEDIAKNLL